MTAFLIFLHVITSILLVVSILLQSSRGGGLAGMMGGGGMGAVFGGRGASTFLSKVTLWLGVAFAVTSIGIGLLSAYGGSRPKSAVQQVMEQEGNTSSPADILPTVPGGEESEGEPGTL